MSLFRCPICGAILTREERSYRCGKNHCYDIAKEGYTHLLPVQQKHSQNPGDDKAMVRSRRAFLSKDYYAPLRRQLEQLALRYTPANGAVLDSGCGEGYYTAAISRADHPIVVDQNTIYIQQAFDMLGVHRIILAIGFVLVLLVPVLRKLLRKIDTSLPVEEGSEMASLHLSQED